MRPGQLTPNELERAILLAIEEECSEYFHLAEEKFEKAWEIREGHDGDLGVFFWRWGQLWDFQGHSSGEVHDYRLALEKYRLADQHGLGTQCLWEARLSSIGIVFTVLALCEGISRKISKSRNKA